MVRGGYLMAYDLSEFDRTSEGDASYSRIYLETAIREMQRGTNLATIKSTMGFSDAVEGILSQTYAKIQATTYTIQFTLDTLALLEWGKINSIQAATRLQLS
jgi:hypothetical protein